MSTSYRYTADEADERRSQVVERVGAALRAELERDPTLQSALLLVAQYWDDEANDAVHCRLVLSTERVPDLTRTSYAARNERSGRFEPSKGSRANMSVSAYGLIDWDDNGDSIALFAAFTKESCHQNMGPLEAYSPYALFTRNAGGLRAEIVGHKLRPWLDGIHPERENDDGETGAEVGEDAPRVVITDIADDFTVTLRARDFVPPFGTRPLVLDAPRDDETNITLERFERQARPVVVHAGVERYVGLLRQWPDDTRRPARLLVEIRAREQLRDDFVRLQQTLAPDDPLDQAALVRIDAELESLDKE
jgi:hypothetical protein